MNQEQKKIIAFIKKTAEEKFAHLVKDGWILLTNKSIKKDGFDIVNFKDGAEFGTIFARSVEMKFDDWLKEKEKPTEREEATLLNDLPVEE